MVRSRHINLAGVLLAHDLVERLQHATAATYPNGVRSPFLPVPEARPDPAAAALRQENEDLKKKLAEAEQQAAAAAHAKDTYVELAICLRDEVADLRATVARQGDEIAALRQTADAAAITAETYVELSISLREKIDRCEKELNRIPYAVVPDDADDTFERRTSEAIRTTRKSVAALDRRFGDYATTATVDDLAARLAGVQFALASVMTEVRDGPRPEGKKDPPEDGDDGDNLQGQHAVRAPKKPAPLCGHQALLLGPAKDTAADRDRRDAWTEWWMPGTPVG